MGLASLRCTSEVNHFKTRLFVGTTNAHSLCARFLQLSATGFAGFFGTVRADATCPCSIASGEPHPGRTVAQSSEAQARRAKTKRRHDRMLAAWTQPASLASNFLTIRASVRGHGELCGSPEFGDFLLEFAEIMQLESCGVAIVQIHDQDLSRAGYAWKQKSLNAQFLKLLADFHGSFEYTL